VRRTEPASARGPRGGRGTSEPGAGVAVADRISALAIAEVGRERRLGLHGFMGNLIEGRSRSPGDPVHSGAGRVGVLAGVWLERQRRKGVN
jgi:hypothetical protein